MNCKYFLPCGYCELKKQQCDEFIGTSKIKIEPFEVQKNIAVSVYGAPAIDITTGGGGNIRWDDNGMSILNTSAT